MAKNQKQKAAEQLAKKRRQERKFLGLGGRCRKDVTVTRRQRRSLGKSERS